MQESGRDRESGEGRGGIVLCCADPIRINLRMAELLKRGGEIGKKYAHFLCCTIYRYRSAGEVLCRVLRPSASPVSDRALCMKIVDRTKGKEHEDRGLGKR